MTTHRRVFAWIAAGWSLPFLAMSAPEYSSIDACSLLTSAEIERVIGAPISKGVKRDHGLQMDGSYSSTCVWTINSGTPAQDDPRAPLRGRHFVILNAIQWPHGKDMARTFLEAFRTAAKNGEITAAPSPRQFGDEALWWGDGLAVRKGDVSFGLSVFQPNEKARKPGHFEEQLAPNVLQKLTHKPSVK